MAKLYTGVNGVAREVKNIYVGVPTVSLTNLLPAVNGIDGWQAYSDDYGTSLDPVASSTHTKYSTSCMRLQGEAGKAETTARTINSIALNPSHIYYARVEGYVESKIGKIAIYWPIAHPPMVYNVYLNAGQWTRCSVRTNRSSFSAGSYPLRIDFDNENKAGYVWYDGMMLIDLTAHFGSGKEPSKEWCDALPYFAGTKQIEYASASSVARKVKRAYIGVNGVARLFYESE